MEFFLQSVADNLNNTEISIGPSGRRLDYLHSSRFQSYPDIIHYSFFELITISGVILLSDPYIG